MTRRPSLLPMCWGGGGALGFPTPPPPLPRHSGVTRPGLRERVGTNRWDQRYRGGPNAQGGKPAREHEETGPEALYTRPRALAPDLTAARLQRTRLPLRAVLPSLGRGFGAAAPVAPALGGGRVPADSHWGKGWAIRGLPGEALEFEARGRRPCMRPRGSPKRKGQSAPARREAAAAAGRLTDSLVRAHPTQPRPRFPRASFGGGAAR